MHDESVVERDEESFSKHCPTCFGARAKRSRSRHRGRRHCRTFDSTGADWCCSTHAGPGLSGHRGVRELRSRSHVTIIMVTPADSEVDKGVGLELGADDYVTKPFSSPNWYGSESATV